MTDADEAANRFSDVNYHPAALVRLAAHYLASGEPGSAFLFADRRCRIPPRANARDYLLRGQTLLALGDRAAAFMDFEHARQLDPTDPWINQNILKAGLTDQPLELAENIVISPRADKQSLDCALDAFLSAGYSAVIRAWRQPDSLDGWIAWQGAPSVELTISYLKGRTTVRSLTLLLIEEPSHWLTAPNWHVANFSVPADFDLRPIIHFAGETQDRLAFVHIDPLFKPPSVAAKSPPGSDSQCHVCTVIVPIYDDLEITRSCLDQLMQQTLSIGLAIILVNDHPENADVQDLLNPFRHMRGLRVIDNPENLGFAGSINCALEEIESGDVLLLNADVLLPAGAIERLHRAAYSAADIGTVTPLSNNGELTSVPDGFRSNPLGTLAQIEAIDHTVAEANAGCVVTMPNGIGFCLYIKRKSLDFIGTIPGIYGRGYYEDVDFCLALRAAGLRNVCALDVFAGHKGGASFKTKKRAFVVRNLRILTSRFPAHRDETAAFMKADPLASTRALITRKHQTNPKKGVLLFASLSGMRTERSAWLRRRGDHPLFLDWETPARKSFRIHGDDPFTSLPFSVDRQGFEVFQEILERQKIQRVEIAVSSECPAGLIAFLRDQNIAVSFLFDAFPMRSDGTHDLTCSSFDPPGPCLECQTAVSDAFQKQASSTFATLLSMQANGAKILATHRMSAAIAHKFMLDVPLEIFPPSAEPNKSVCPSVLGILNIDPTLSSERLLRKLAGSFLNHNLRFVVIGTTSDDLGLMARGNVFVTGPVAPGDYPLIFRHHGIQSLFWPHRWQGFAAIDRLAQEFDCPQAYFDWSFGTMDKRVQDLAIDPRLCDDAASALMAGWAGSFSDLPA